MDVFNDVIVWTSSVLECNVDACRKENASAKNCKEQLIDDWKRSASADKILIRPPVVFTRRLLQRTMNTIQRIRKGQNGFSKHYTVTVEAMDSYAKAPCARYWLAIEKYAQSSKPEHVGDLRFSMNHVDFSDGEFVSTLSNMLASGSDINDSFLVTLEIRIQADEFFKIESWTFASTFIVPAVPSFLGKNDYRTQMFLTANAKPDFTIETLDGDVKAVRYLLYLTIERIRIEVDANPNIRSVTVNFHKLVVKEMINYALKGSFDLFDSSTKILDEFLTCIRFYRPYRFWGLIHRLTNHLGDKLNEQWRTLSLNELLEYLRLGCHQRLHEVSAKAAIIVANLHYKELIRDYNADSTGEQLEMYHALHRAEFPFDGNGYRKIQSIYYAGRNVSRILRCRNMLLRGK
ncbi:unnamed protein product [Toxocara canis]|uniref:Uncharacterized protein n=1 Tax=Toxocara canis TaxID=6265 RepID=A0A3P7FXS3_TOXCA|nr:unnamed protein product [Toxocara canis]